MLVDHRIEFVEEFAIKFTCRNHCRLQTLVGAELLLQSTALVHQIDDGSKQKLRTERLGDIGIYTSLQTLDLACRAVEGCQRHDRNMACIEILTQKLYHLNARNVRHHDVGNHQVVSVFCTFNLCQSFPTILCRIDIEIAHQFGLHKFAQVFIILDEQHMLAIDRGNQCRQLDICRLRFGKQSVGSKIILFRIVFFSQGQSDRENRPSYRIGTIPDGAMMHFDKGGTQVEADTHTAT